MKLTDEEVAQRASGLSALGNSPARIRTILNSAGASAEQIESAMAPIESKLFSRRRADARYLQLQVGVCALLLVAVVGAIFFTSGPGGTTIRPDSNQPAATSQRTQPAQSVFPALPAEWMGTALPTGLAPDFMASTPVVQQGDGPASSDCPLSDTQAAGLFGGQPRDWTYDATGNGWSMMTIGSAVTIRVPENMVAGYLIITDSPQMLSVDGPATLTNVNFVAISCP